METLARDVRVALRGFRRAPGFAVGAVLTLAVGIGASTAIFSVVDGVLLRPLPYAEADRAVALWQHDRGASEPRDAVSAANFLDWNERATRFARMAAIEPFSLGWVGEEGPQELNTWRVTREFFEILGTRPHLGRLLRAADYEPGAPAVVVLGYATWRGRFGGDTTLVGRTISLDDGPYVVSGVLPPDFQYPPNGELWTPHVFTESARQARAQNFYQVIGRLAPGVSLDEARAEMDLIAAQLAREHPDPNAEIGVTVVPLEAEVLGPVRPAMLALLGSVIVLLLIACVNVANLMLARGAQRGAELAVRVAMGAGRTRILRQLSVEALVLGIAGGGLGAVLASWSVAGLRSLAPASLPRIETVAVDARVLAFTAIVSVLTAALFGLAPLLQATRLDLTERLGEAGRGSGYGRAPVRLADVLVAGQLALAVILLAAAGLVGRSVIHLMEQDLGYVTENVAAFQTQAWRYYPDPGSRVAFVERATEELASAPGVVAAGMTSSLPLGGQLYAERATFTVIGQPEPRPGQEPSARGAAATAGYFAALGVPLRAGRMFRDTDDADAPTVVLVSEALARRHFGGTDPVGEQMLLSFAGPPRRAEIIGVVGNVRHRGPDDSAEPAIYVPHAQHPTGAITLTVRTAGPVAPALAGLKQRIWDLNPRLTLTDTGTLEALLADTLRARRFYLLLLGAFSSAALFLGVVGIYGVVSYAVRHRMREIGIRVALGAGARAILRLFLARAARLVALGLAAGLAGSVMLTRYLGSLLYQIQPTDPLTLAGASALLAMVAMAATWVPARRASRIDPATVLRGA